MFTKSLKNSLFLMAFAIFFYSCGDEENQETEDMDNMEETGDSGEPEEAEINTAPAVCIWKTVSLRKAHTAQSDYITSIYLGETATYMGITETDTTVKKGKDYAKIELVDGTTGWVDDRFIAIDAAPYAVKGISKLYKRPDILTATKKEYDKMQFVVVLETKGEWMKVKGKRNKDQWFSDGWIKANHLTNNSVDISVAILASRAMAIGDKEKKIEALNEIIDNSDFSGSIFIKDISSIVFDLSEEEEAVEEEATEDYED
ncbi:MAG: SH3 domain-containing protein [Bacteroidota bacterium]